MRLPCLRFTVRRLMVAVAVVGVIIAIEMGRRRRSELLARFEWHGSWEHSYQERAEILTYFVEKMVKMEAEADEAEDARMWKVSAEDRDRRRKSFLVLADYHASLRAKYEKAALIPWISVSLDPPEPPVPPAPSISIEPLPKLAPPSGWQR